MQSFSTHSEWGFEKGVYHVRNKGVVGKCRCSLRHIIVESSEFMSYPSSKQNISSGDLALLENFLVVVAPIDYLFTHYFISRVDARKFDFELPFTNVFIKL